MPIATLILAALMATSAAWATDDFVGDWKLNPAKSFAADGRALKDGRALIEPDNAGGYLQISETVFGEGPALRFNTRVQFDGTPGDGTLENHPVRYVSKRIEANGFEISIRDGESGQVSRVIRATLSPQAHTLTMLWSDGNSAPIRSLVYEKLPAGPLLEPGKTVEQPFGPGAIFEYRVNLRAGEYCQGKVEQKGGSINIATYGPDDARIRSFGAPPDGKNQFAIEAAASGTYRIVLRSAVKPATSYSITVEKIGSTSQRLRPEPAKEKFTSPRIAKLRRDVESGNDGAVTTFWSEIDKRGAPMIESMDDNHSDNLVTFLWRARSETRNVFILWFPFCVAKPDDYQMVQLGNTDGPRAQNPV